MKRYIPFLLAFSLFASCSKTPDVDPGLIVFGTKGAFLSAEVSTKAAEVTAMDSFHVGCVTGEMGATEVERFNAVFSGSPEANLYSAGLFWPSEDPSYHFYASNAALEPHATGYTVAAAAGTDVVCAVLAEPNYRQKNTLVFAHVFARIGEVTVQAEPEYTVSGVSIAIIPNVGGTYDLLQGRGRTDGTGWSEVTAGSPVALVTGGAGVYPNDVWLVPGTYTLTASWTITRGDYTKTYSGRTCTVSLMGGCINRISTVLGGDASSILVGVEVEPWGVNDIDVVFGD